MKREINVKRVLVIGLVVAIWIILWAIISFGFYQYGKSTYVYCWDSLSIDEPLLIELCGITKDQFNELGMPEDCPDGYIFGDYSTVLATSVPPKSRKDFSEMNKDDKVTAKDLDGNVAENEWHQGVRADYAKAPTTNYKNRKVYIDNRLDFNTQLEDIRKDRTSKRINKSKTPEMPEWIRKAYNK